MTSNAILDRSSGALGYQPDGPRYGTQEWCDWRNATMPREDIEWVVGKNGCFLQDRQSWSEARRKEIERDHEHQRQIWMRNQNRLA